jgi:Zn ribbon nucleic-acid-binding protein
MGWYGDYTKCPNCGSKNASEMYRNDMLSSYYLICVDCGLHIFAPKRLWVVKNSYIDKSVIGKDPQDLDLSEIVDEDRNENIIPEGATID